MTAEELRLHFPNASEQFIRANASDAGRPAAATPPPRDLAPPPLVERREPDEPLAADLPQASHPGRYVVRVTAFCVRLLDEDNLCEKFHVDSLRYAGIIPGDSPDRCRIITTQKKVATKKEERTEIVITQTKTAGR